MGPVWAAAGVHRPRSMVEGHAVAPAEATGGGMPSWWVRGCPLGLRSLREPTPARRPPHRCRRTPVTSSITPRRATAALPPEAGAMPRTLC
eukprot:CAMPEP_0182900232 /NCGR_PEP_ID=MMETSP0034_2-20130328/28693_1 /TAXON_ID=156128 /ORGANISM="Nephroselmis pyriformis, Strain CCMP717" /LENGTH=90 /DNA_ID=CAMNT_0025034409 /DNA_START=63 /DNA_END=333 /DNA_ORIENTATION=+